MRFGCCLNTVSHSSDGTGAEAAPVLAQAGYEYIELSLSHVVRLSPNERDRVLRPIRDSGLPCEACNIFFPPTVRLTGPAADHRAALAYADDALGLARKLGAEIVVFGSGKARNPPEGYPYERAWDQLIAFARDLDVLAATHGIVIAMEHLNRSESDILTSFSDVIRFVKETDRPRIRALMDTYHLELERESPEVILRGQGLLAHTHIARTTGRTWPQRATPQLRGIFSALSEIHYQGRMSVEAYSENLLSDAVQTLKVLKELEREAQGFEP